MKGVLVTAAIVCVGFSQVHCITHTQFTINLPTISESKYKKTTEPSMKSEAEL